MTHKEALEILRNATALLNLNRADHVLIMNALTTLETPTEVSEKKDA